MVMGLVVNGMLSPGQWRDSSRRLAMASLQDQTNRKIGGPYIHQMSYGQYDWLTKRTWILYKDLNLYNLII